MALVRLRCRQGDRRASTLSTALGHVVEDRARPCSEAMGAFLLGVWRRGRAPPGHAGMGIATDLFSPTHANTGAEQQPVCDASCHTYMLRRALLCVALVVCVPRVVFGACCSWALSFGLKMGSLGILAQVALLVGDRAERLYGCFFAMCCDSPLPPSIIRPLLLLSGQRLRVSRLEGLSFRWLGCGCLRSCCDLWTPGLQPAVFRAHVRSPLAKLAWFRMPSLSKLLGHRALTRAGAPTCAMQGQRMNHPELRLMLSWRQGLSS